MLRLLRLWTILALLLAAAAPARAAGTLPLALTQQIDINGRPLAGCLLYFLAAGTVGTPQNEFTDFGLTNAGPNPLSCDQTGRIPLFWLADGLIHVRLTDSSGIVQVDTTMQVLGPSSGGGGGGGGVTIDPTSVASSGDFKWRPTAEILTGWVRANGQTIGSAASGGSERANADTQNLFVYLWTNCANTHCPVPGGRGATALADFQANKQITLPNMQDSLPLGRDCMGATCAGGLLASNVTSGGGDGVDTPGAFGGVANTTTTTTLAPENIPNYVLPVIDPGHFHSAAINSSGATDSNNPNGEFPAVLGSGITGFFHSPNGTFFAGGGNGGPGGFIGKSSTGITVNSGGSGTAATSATFAVMNPFRLGTWYIKL